MSEAGKPIYSYNKREDTVTLMPLCSALIDYAQRTQKEALASMKTSDNLSISFFTRSPLIFIVINEIDSSIDPTTLVEQVEAQMISILTRKTLQTVFEERPTFDLTRLLHGNEKFIDAMINLVITNVQTSKSNQSFQGMINSIVAKNSKTIVFSTLFQMKNDEIPHLLAICNHHQSHRLKIPDVHIILALIQGSKAQLSSAESLWLPVCLPRFNGDSFLHSYIAFVNDANYCLVMFSVDRDDFEVCQVTRRSIEAKLGEMVEKRTDR